MSTIADTSDDINDVLGVIVEDVSTFTRHAAIRAAKAARWAWTLGQLVVGQDTTKRKARARRVRIKRERATERRRQAQEFARMERERGRAEAKREAEVQRAAEKVQRQATDRPAHQGKTAGQAPSTAKVQQHQSTNTHPSSLRAGARTGAMPTPLGVVMAGEAVDYETTESALQDIATELSTHAGTIEMLAGSIGNAGIGGDTAALLAEGLEMALAAAKILEAAHEQFVATQGQIHELAHAFGGIGSNEFHGVG